MKAETEVVLEQKAPIAPANVILGQMAEVKVSSRDMKDLDTVLVILKGTSTTDELIRAKAVAYRKSFISDVCNVAVHTRTPIF